MRVLIATPLYPPDIGGPATYSKLLEVELPKKSIDVQIVNFGSVRRFPKGIRHLLYLFKLLHSGIRADVIFALDPVSTGYPASIASRLLGKPLIIKIVGDYAWEQGRQRFGVEELLDDFLTKRYGGPVERFRRVQAGVARYAQKLIVPSEYLKKIVMSWGAPAGKISVVYNSVEAPDDLLSRDEARARCGAGEGEFLIISAGRDVPWKGFDALREAVAGLRAEPPGRFRLEIFHNLPHRELLTWLRAADVFVLNSGYEGFPHIVLEAMTVGTPVVASRAGGNGEVVRDGENGLLIRYNNRDELKSAILKLYKNESLRREIAQKGKETADKFSKEKMISGTIKVLEL